MIPLAYNPRTENVSGIIAAADRASEHVSALNHATIALPATGVQSAIAVTSDTAPTEL